MTNYTVDDLVKELGSWYENMRFRHTRRMISGRRLENGTVTLEGAPTGKTWVRGSDASREETAAWGTVNRINAGVKVAPDFSGELEIIGVDWSETVARMGDTARTILQPVGMDETVPHSIPAIGFVPLRVQGSTAGGLNVAVAEGNYEHNGVLKRWGGGSIDLTSHVPSTAAHARWVLIYLDPSTDALGAVSGALIYGDGNFLTESQLAAIGAPVGTLPLGGVVLRYGQTSISPSNTRFSSARLFVGRTGGVFLDSSGAIAGDVITWNGSEFTLETPTPPSITVSDGTTAIAELNTLNVEGATLTDNGGGVGTLTIPLFNPDTILTSIDGHVLVGLDGNVLIGAA